MRLGLIFVIALSIQLLFANEEKLKSEKSFIEKLRPQITKALGEKWAEKLIGKEDVSRSESIKMPVLPEIEENAKSTAIYNKKKDKVTIKEEVEKKFNYAFIGEVYQATRQSRPNEDEIGKLMNVLSQGGSREGVYRSLVLDSVYAGMENWDKPVKKKSALFAVYFYEKYLGKKIAIKRFEGMNIFTLKRVITEKTLDMADAFSSEQRDELERWYALMSADFAGQFFAMWENPVRKNSSAEFHKAWANKVPLQHIKSEIIIKLHSAFNFMI